MVRGAEIARPLAPYWDVQPHHAETSPDFPTAAGLSAGQLVVVVQGRQTEPDATYGLRIVSA